DTVMSIDNIIGVAGAAKDSMMLIVIGISVSVPVILWGSRLILKVMDRFPVLILLGAGLIGWVAGGMFASDAALPGRFRALSWAVPFGSVLLTVLIGKWRASRRARMLRDLAQDYGKDEL
ncbi:MAG TPA: TerC family protein, partial [Burkholderiales bacterium]|nr:TerC family protein [Burkholderiales bacterium]